VTPHHLPEFFTLPILVSVIVIKELLFRFVSKVGNEVDSSALKGDAWHHRADAITSLAAFIGISVALIGGPGWEPADDYAALVCAFVIGSTGLNLLRRSVAELMDRAPDETILNQIRKVASSVSGVKLVEKILARKSGLNYLVELHIHADPLMSLHDAHILGGTVKTQLRRQLPAIGAVTIHMEPANGEA
jgi:cation diffusion facilitator family transporter